MDIGSLLTLIFLSFLIGTTIYSWKAADIAIPNTMFLLCFVWLVSLFSVKFTPVYPVVTVALVDLAAAAWLFESGRPRGWQLIIATLFAGMIACHVGYLANLISFSTEPNFVTYLDLLTILSYGQIFVVLWARRQDANSGLGKHNLASRFTIWAMDTHPLYSKTRKKA